MLTINIKRLEQIRKNFAGKRIAVFGDMMLDCYFWGEVQRISPEAPVPIVEVDEEFYRFGGAANVAFNILKLGGIPLPIGVIGADNDGDKFISLMNNIDISSKGIIIDENRPTTAKIRVIADHQHVVRIDKESKKNINHKIEKQIFKFLSENIDSIDGIILQDYNKGVLTKNLIGNIIQLANKEGKIIAVDPKFKNFFEFKNVTVFKPNRSETERVFGMKIEDDKDIDTAGAKLLENLHAKYVLLTLGKEGIALFEKGEKAKRIGTKARKVSDVSGAGDTVISTLTIALAAQANISEAAYLANFAGGLVCEEVGIVPIEIDKLFNTVEAELK